MWLISLGLVACVFGWLVYQHKKRNPEKSYAIAVANIFLIPFRALGVGPFGYGELTPKTMMKVMSKAVQLDDFGDTAFVAADAVFRQQPDFISSDQFTNVGYLMAANELQLTYTRRLKAIEYLKRNPSVTGIPVRQPIFVFGLGRSGTTFVHRLLSLDPRGHAPLLWQLASPVPAAQLTDSSSAEAFAADNQQRAAAIRTVLSMRHVMGDDGLEKFHEIAFDLPEECLYDLCDELPCCPHMLPALYTHTGLLTPADHLRALRWHRKMLQLLSLQSNDRNNERRWVLKFPYHIHMIPELAEVFPDAKLVWAHRHPAPTVSSQCAMQAAIVGLYVEKQSLDAVAFGRKIAAVCEKALAEAPQAIADSGLDCAHVLFEQLVADPVAVIKGIYQQFGMDFTDDYEAILKAYLEENRLKRQASMIKLGSKKVLHEHKPEDFGLATQSLNEGVFAEYTKAFGITSSK